MKILGKRSQTISFGTFTKNGSSQLQPISQLELRLPVTFTSLNTNVATVSATGMVSLVANGHATIRASQVGNIIRPSPIYRSILYHRQETLRLH